MGGGDNNLEVKFGGSTSELDVASNKAAEDIKKVANAAEQTKGPLARMGDYFKKAQADFAKGWAEGAAEWSHHIKHGAAEAGEGTKKFAEDVTGATSSVTRLIAVAERFAIIGGMIAAPAALVEWGEKFGEMAEQLEQMSQKLGMSAENVSQWSIVANNAGISTAQFGSSATRLERAMVMAANGGKMQSAMFKELGINITSASTASDVMLQVADKFKDMENGPKKTAIAMGLMGRAGAQMIPIFNQGSEALKEQFKVAEEYGATATPEFMQAGLAMKEAMNEGRMGAQGLQQTLFTALAPAIVAIVEGANDMVKEFIASYREGGAARQAVDALSFGLKSLVAAIETVVVAFKVLWSGAQAVLGGLIGGVETLGSVISRVAHGDFEGAKAAWNNGWQNTGDFIKNQWHNAQEGVAKYQDSVRKMWAGHLSGKAKEAPEEDGGIGDLSIPGMGKKGKNGAAEAKKLAREALQAQLEALTFKQELAQEDYDEQMRLEEQKLAKLKAFYGEDSREYTRELENKTRMERRHQQQVVKEAQDAIKVREQIAQTQADSEDAISQTRTRAEQAHFEALDQMGMISARQRLDHLKQEQAAEQAEQLAHENRIYEIKKKAIQDQLALMNLPREARIALNGQLEELEAQHTAKIAQLDATAQAAAQAAADRAMQQSVQKWQGWLGPVEQAVNGFLGSMLTRSQSFGQALIAMGDQLLMSLVQAGTKALFKHIVIEHAKTAATAAGVSARTTVEAAGAATSTGISAMSALKQIAHHAAVAAAGAYAAIASIPIVGPFLAPAVAAAALYGVFRLAKSVFSAEGGMDNVPYDNAPFLLHKNEMVLPAKYANPLRTMLAGAGPRESNLASAAAAAGKEARSEVQLAAAAPPTPASSDFHYHDHSGTMTPDQIHENRGAIASAIKTAHREGHFVGFSGFGARR